MDFEGDDASRDGQTSPAEAIPRKSLPTTEVNNEEQPSRPEASRNHSSVKAKNETGPLRPVTAQENETSSVSDKATSLDSKARDGNCSPRETIENQDANLFVTKNSSESPETFKKFRIPKRTKDSETESCSRSGRSRRRSRSHDRNSSPDRRKPGRQDANARVTRQTSASSSQRHRPASRSRSPRRRRRSLSSRRQRSKRQRSISRQRRSPPSSPNCRRRSDRNRAAAVGSGTPQTCTTRQAKRQRLSRRSQSLSPTRLLSEEQSLASLEETRRRLLRDLTDDVRPALIRDEFEEGEITDSDTEELDKKSKLQLAESDRNSKKSEPVTRKKEKSNEDKKTNKKQDKDEQRKQEKPIPKEDKKIDRKQERDKHRTQEKLFPKDKKIEKKQERDEQRKQEKPFSKEDKKSGKKQEGIKERRCEHSSSTEDKKSDRNQERDEQRFQRRAPRNGKSRSDQKLEVADDGKDSALSRKSESGSDKENSKRVDSDQLILTSSSPEKSKPEDSPNSSPIKPANPFRLTDPLGLEDYSKRADPFSDPLGLSRDHLKLSGEYLAAYRNSFKYLI